MGAKEGAMILELIARLKREGKLSMIMILHNYTHVLESCDRVNMIVAGVRDVYDRLIRPHVHARW